MFAGSTEPIPTAHSGIVPRWTGYRLGDFCPVDIMRSLIVASQMSTA